MSDRTVTRARTDDGVRCMHWSTRIINGDSRLQFIASSDPSVFGEAAVALWSHWANRLPNLLRRRLIAEVGEVTDGPETRRYRIAHVNGAILPNDENSVRFVSPLAWSNIPRNLPLILGPSATLALTDFALNGMVSVPSEADWPFGDAFEIFDTDASPYPPQGFPFPHDEVLLTPATVFTETFRDDLWYIVACRNECWQRPVDTLYNVRRRNLRLSHLGPLRAVSGPHLVLNNLTAEVEPCLGLASFLAHPSFHYKRGEVSPCHTSLAVKFHVTTLLHAFTGPAGPVSAACICDPIEGDIYGYAPPLMLRRDAQIELEDAST